MPSSAAVTVGSVAIGGGAPVSIQSMLTRPLDDTDAALEQTEALRTAGCEIVRVALPGHSVLPALKAYLAEAVLPVVADIHFDGRLAVRAIEAGCHKIRINPANLQNPGTLTDIVAAAKANSIPIRVGLNSGSVAPRSGIRPTDDNPAALLVDAALDGVRSLEKLGFHDIVVSAKCPDVTQTIDIYRRLAATLPYPLHLGVTAAGGLRQAVIKHGLAFGVLLGEGIGDTMRVSVTGDPVEEVRAGWDILRGLGRRRRGAVMIACPTCGRTKVDLQEIAAAVESALEDLVTEIGEENWPDDIRSVAVMGCIVNGPGEAAAADIGAAFEHKNAVIFRKGDILERVPAASAVAKLVSLIEEAASGIR
ncbi:MAG: flavodoxin-dependent (E)-4-hydroxy-3-methylbut-2-enyl-diphosphate synthase [Planctomycetes bacterium]|nr:flavodoxin-dependent (E)-4-hydroxy-3-methylbut-2-enyl-diphosphate synthase [Planctomycetota bacterium]